MKKETESVMVFENNAREKVYLGTTQFEPVLDGGEWAFAEPSDPSYRRIAVRPFRYCVLPLLVVSGGEAVAWGVFTRAKDGHPDEVWIRTAVGAKKVSATSSASTSRILGPDGKPAR